MKVLIVRFSSFGDILHTLPAVQLLRKWDATAQIHWLVNEKYRDFVAMVPGINRVIPLPGRWRLWPEVRRQLRQEKYDVALDFQGLLKSAIWTSESGARHRYGFHRRDLREPLASLFYNRHPSYSCEVIGGRYREASFHGRPDSIVLSTPPEHVIFKNTGLVEFLGVPQTLIIQEWTPQIRLDIPERARAEVTEWLARQGPAFSQPVVLHPGAGWPTKLWPEERWREVATSLARVDGYGVVFTGGPDDRRYIDRIIGTGIRGVARFPYYDWPRTSALIERAVAVIAPDTGVAHLAAGLGRPVVFLMGATDPNRNGPWMSDRQIALYHKQPCSPCYRRKCPYALECMMEIKPHEVLNRFRLLLERQTFTRNPQS